MITDNHKPYKQRKVRILNGAHTSMVLGAYLSGQNIVRECMEDDVIQQFMNKTIYDEIIPTLTLPKEELEDFAASVTERFKNPFIDHSLLAISLNSTSKWRARVMPSLKGYVEIYGALPKCITVSFAFYAAFYRGVRREENAMIKNDDCETYMKAICSNTALWGEDLTQIPGFVSASTDALKKIEMEGAYEVMKQCL